MAGENVWVDCSVGDLAANTRNALVGGPFGSNLLSRDYTPSGVPVIRGQNLSVGKWVGGEFVFVSDDKAESLSANLARPGDLVFTQRGNAVLNGGQVAIVPDGSHKRFVVSQSQMKLTVDATKADATFLYYVFRSPGHEEYLRSNAIVTGVPHTNLGLLRDYRVLLPPLPEQRAIASILGSLDDKIELNRRMNETLEGIARALFKSWFVDFDPVRAKMDGRQPAGMSPEIANLFPSAFEHVNGELVPKRWKVEPLSCVATLQAESVSPGSRPDKTWEHYSIPAYDERRQPSLELGEDIKSNKYVVPVNCILVSKLNPQFPRVWLPDVCDGNAAITSTEFMPFVPQKTCWRSFVYETARSEFFQSEIQMRVTGNTGSRQRVKPKEVAEIPIVKPPDNLIDAFGSVAKTLHTQQLANILLSNAMANLRDTLLPKLLSGELRAIAADKILEEVL